LEQTGGVILKKVLVLLAKGFEEIEAVTVIDILRRAHVKVHICSIDKEFVEGSHGITIKSDVRLEYIDINKDIYDLVYLPGGMPGAANLRDDERVIELLKKYNGENVMLSAICAAPIVLSEAGLLKDKEATSFPGFKEVIDCNKYLEEVTVTSGNVITSRGPATAMELGYTLLEKLGLASEAHDLREDMLYNFLLEKKGKAK
jgi:4-methyl-5(b-hydroxyethyl)-thiazole monophosphate biosynthesis